MLAMKTRWMYTVRMKKITATEARKDWFRLLDEVAAGEVAIIERNGRRLRLAREEESSASPDVPDYSALIRAQALDEAVASGNVSGYPEQFNELDALLKTLD